MLGKDYVNINEMEEEKAIARKECELAILDKLQEIVDIYHDYNPDGEYLSLSYNAIDGDVFKSVNNCYWVDENSDSKLPISAVRQNEEFQQIYGGEI